MLVSRASFEAEKSIIRRIAEGKNSLPHVSPTFVPGDNSGPGVARAAPELTPGQRQAVELVLTTRDRFVSIQGYAGVGKTAQFQAVLAGINALPVAQQPRVIWLAPTHRALGKMQSAGVEAQRLASFLREAGRRLAAGETPDYRNTLFLVDESSMIGNSDMAKTHTLIVEGGGRAVTSGDEAQLQPIAPGTPFRLVQGAQRH